MKSGTHFTMPETEAENVTSPSKGRKSEDNEPFYADFSKSKGATPSLAVKQIEDTIYWKDPKVSGAVFGGGLLWFYFTTLGGYTIVSLVSILMIVHLVGSVVHTYYLQFRGQDTSGRKPPQVDAEVIKKGIDSVVSHVNTGLQWYWTLLGASNLMAALYVMGALLLVWIIGSWFDAYTLLFLGFVSVFTVPIAYRSNQQACDDAFAKVKVQVQQAVDKVKAQIPTAGKAEDGKKSS